MKITREQLRRWGACYTDEKIAVLVPWSGLTPLEVSALDIPEEDRLWVLLREELIPARDLRLLACDWAESACRAAGWDDQRSLEAIAVARRFAVGEATEVELAAAEKAAWAAWDEAAWAERSAAAKVAWSAAAKAARSAAAASAEKAAWAAAEAAEKAAWAAVAEAWAAQLADVVRVIKRIDEAAKAGKEAKE